MKLNCIIVDDEPVARKVLEEYIEDVDFLQLAGKAENPIKATAILNDNKIDLLFLDINMPKMNGIEFLRSSATLPLTILTTAYTEYAIEGFELDVIDYLIKPFSFERFLKACTKAKEFYTLKNTQTSDILNEPGLKYFFVKCDNRIEKILYEELVYVEARLNYVVLHTEDRKLIVYLTIKGIAEQLPGSIFLKIHKSTIVNINKIKSIEGNAINMGLAKVIISQNLRDDVMKQILKDKMLKR
jgi:two-component system, LytTR family, response regulator